MQIPKRKSEQNNQTQMDPFLTQQKINELEAELEKIKFLKNLNCKIQRIKKGIIYLEL